MNLVKLFFLSCISFFVAAQQVQINLLVSDKKVTKPFSLDKGKRGIVPDIVQEIFKDSGYCRFSGLEHHFSCS